MGKTKPKGAAVISIDGRVFDSYSLRYFAFHLTKKGISDKHYFLPLEEAENFFSSRERLDPQDDTYEEALRQQEGHARDMVFRMAYGIECASETDVRKAAKQYVAEHFPIIRRHLTFLSKHGYRPAIVSGAPSELMESFGERFGVQDVLSTRYQVDEKGRYTGKVIDTVITEGEKSEKVLEFLEREKLSANDSIGIADNLTDVGFLKLLGKNVVFGNDPHLLHMAKNASRGVRIVSELEDVDAFRETVGKLVGE